MKWVTGAARARFLAAFARSKAVPPEAGASMTCAPHLRDDGPAKRRGRENGVRSMLGHYSAGFTLDTYAHVTTDAQLKAAQTMGNILSRAV